MEAKQLQHFRPRRFQRIALPEGVEEKPHGLHHRKPYVVLDEVDHFEDGRALLLGLGVRAGNAQRKDDAVQHMGVWRHLEDGFQAGLDMLLDERMENR